MNSQNTALIVIDIQNDFCTKDSAYNKLGYPINQNKILAKKIREILPRFKNKGISVCYIISKYDNYFIKGNKCNFCLSYNIGSESYLLKEEADKIIVKNTHDGFYNTELESYLKLNKIKNVLISGISTSVCVDSTARSAIYRGFNTTILKDLVSSRDKNFHKFALKNFGKNFGNVDTSKNILLELKK